MTTETTTTYQARPHKKYYHSRGASEAVYGLGMIGAWVYFIGHATTFWIGVLGFLKGLVWPALLVYEFLKNFNM